MAFGVQIYRQTNNKRGRAVLSKYIVGNRLIVSTKKLFTCGTAVVAVATTPRKG